jgi:hypothetical protein
MMTRKLIGMWALAGALIFMVAAKSDALSCKDPKACTNAAYCTDTCTLDSAAGTGIVSCQALNPGGCVKCWDQDTKLDQRGETAKGSQLAAGAFTAWNVRTDFKCSNGVSIYVRTTCQYDLKGPCAAAGFGVSGDVCCFFWFGHPCQGGC